jgi:thiol-disulfide isomerase/thioredoxin
MQPLLDAPIRTSAPHLERLLAAGRPTVVVFEVPGCAPCRSLVASLDDLAREFVGRALFVRLEDARLGWLAARHRLCCVPTLLFWNAGEERARIEGNAGAEAIRAHLAFVLGGGIRPEPASGPRHTLEAVFGPFRPRPPSAGPAGLLAPHRAPARGGIL